MLRLRPEDWTLPLLATLPLTLALRELEIGQGLGLSLLATLALVPLAAHARGALVTLGEHLGGAGGGLLLRLAGVAPWLAVAASLLHGGQGDAARGTLAGALLGLLLGLGGWAALRRPAGTDDEDEVAPAAALGVRPWLMAAGLLTLLPWLAHSAGRAPTALSVAAGGGLLLLGALRGLDGLLRPPTAAPLRRSRRRFGAVQATIGLASLGLLVLVAHLLSQEVQAAGDVLALGPAASGALLVGLPLGLLLGGLRGRGTPAPLVLAGLADEASWLLLLGVPALTAAGVFLSDEGLIALEFSAPERAALVCALLPTLLGLERRPRGLAAAIPWLLLAVAALGLVVVGT